MNEKERRIVQRLHYKLITNIRTEEIAPLLYSKEVISGNFLSDILHKSTPNAEKMSALLFEVCDRCSMPDFLECLDEAGYDFSGTEIRLLIEKPDSSLQIRNYARQSTSQNSSFVDSFAEKVKFKILNSEARNFKGDFKHWAKRLLYNQRQDRLCLSESRQQADCCFILLDSLAVIERTHCSDKDNLWKSPVFPHMEYLISKTSNPISSRIRHHARYGVALFLGGKDEEGEEYIEAALKDAKTFLHSGRDIGNCMFALVNYKLNQCRKMNTIDDKHEILSLIEDGIGYFQNEDEDMRSNWRGVYLDKKISCHLALDPSGRAITNAPISNEDLKVAKECLSEMSTLSRKDKRRKMHFYREQACLYKRESEFWISRGFLYQALELCKEGGYESELHILEQELGEHISNLTNYDSVTPCMTVDLTWGDGSQSPEEEQEGGCLSETNSPPRQSSGVSPVVITCTSDIYQKLNIENNTLTSSKESDLVMDE